MPVPVGLPPGTLVTALAAGRDHSLGLTSGGQVLAWGFNGSGQLGNGTTVNGDVPVLVSLPPGTTVTAISGGNDFSVALTSTGQVYAWGYGGQGQLGNGLVTSSDVPVLVSVPPGTTITAIAAERQPRSWR